MLDKLCEIHIGVLHWIYFPHKQLLRFSDVTTRFDCCYPKFTNTLKEKQLLNCVYEWSFPSSSHPNTFLFIQKNIYEFTFLKTISDEANGVSHKRAKNKLQIFFYSKLYENDKSVDLSMYILKYSDLTDFVMFVQLKI